MERLFQALMFVDLYGMAPRNPEPVAYVIYLKVKGTSPFVFLCELAKQVCNKAGQFLLGK